MTVNDFIEKIDDDTYVIVRNSFTEIKGYLYDTIEEILYEFEFCDIDHMFIDTEAYVDEAGNRVAGWVIVTGLA